MNKNSIIKNFKSYLIELTIVTIGVLIALVLSNIRENNQTRKYQIASIETVKNEVGANSSKLKGVIEKQTMLLDTIKNYSNDSIPLGELFSKVGGLKVASLGNTGIEFYTRNQVNLIDFKMMSTLIEMNISSELINSKIDKLADYIYKNIFVDPKESKMLVIIYLDDILQSENQLMHSYEDFEKEYIEIKHETE